MGGNLLVLEHSLYEVQGLFVVVLPKDIADVEYMILNILVIVIEDETWL